MDIDKELTPFEKEEYQYLKNRVDRLMDAALKLNPEPDAAQRLHQAREELRQFVNAKRDRGVRI